MPGNIYINNIDNILPFNYGLSDVEGKTTMTRYITDQKEDSIDKEPVFLQTLDSFQIKNLGLIKLNGNELNTIYGGLKTIHDNNFPLIIINNKEELNKEELNKEELNKEELKLYQTLNKEELKLYQTLNKEELKLYQTLNKEELNKEELNKEELNKEELNKEELNKEELNKEELNKEELNKEELNKEELKLYQTLINLGIFFHKI